MNRNFVFICVIVFVFIRLIFPVRAEEYTFSANEIGERGITSKWSDFIDALPEEIKREIEDINSDDPLQSIENVREKTGFEYWTDKITQVISESFGDVFGSVASLLGLMMLMTAVHIVLPDNANLTSSFKYASSLVCAVFLFTQVSLMIKVTSDFLDRICWVMNLMTPIIDAIYLASGELTQAGVAGSALMLGVTLVGNAAGGILVPVTEVLFTLTAVSSVCDEVNIGSLAESVRRFLMRLWQLLCLFFSFMLASQTTLARHADDLAAKTAKFAIGSFIPMAGGMISEAFSTLRTGISFLKGAAGISGIIVILLIMIPGIIPLLLYRLGLTITFESAKILRLDSISKMLGEAGGIVELLIGIVMCSALMFVFAVIIFTKIGVGL